MTITDQWTPLFDSLKGKVSERGRRLLLSRMIGQIQEITQSTFGESGVNRPEPWPALGADYARKWHGGDNTPTLLLSDAKHSLRHEDSPHLIDMFKTDLSANKASLTNTSEYADVHQLGIGVKKRPFYPETEGVLTPVAEKALEGVVEKYFDPLAP